MGTSTARARKRQLVPSVGRNRNHKCHAFIVSIYASALALRRAWCAPLAPRLARGQPQRSHSVSLKHHGKCCSPWARNPAQPPLSLTQASWQVLQSMRLAIQHSLPQMFSQSCRREQGVGGLSQRLHQSSTNLLSMQLHEERARPTPLLLEESTHCHRGAHAFAAATGRT